MPAFYKIDKERKLVMSAGSGYVTKAQVLAYQKQLSNDPDFHPGFSELADFAQVTKVDIEMSDVPRFAKSDVFSSHSRRAIIVKGDVAFAFAKMFEISRALTGGSEIRVFRNHDEAVDWLFAPGADSTCLP